MTWGSNQAPRSISASQFLSRPGCPVEVGPKGSNVMNCTGEFSSGLSVPLADVTVAGGSNCCWTHNGVSGDPSHHSASVQALPYCTRRGGVHFLHGEGGAGCNFRGSFQTLRLCCFPHLDSLFSAPFFKEGFCIKTY